MALKRKLNKEQYNKLSDDFKKEYKAGTGDDEFLLDTEGDEDTGPLKRALERERSAAGTSKARVEELERQLEELSTNDAKKNGDIATLEKQWQKKLDTQKAEFDGKLSKSNAHIQKTMVDNVASEMAGRISKAPALLLPHIRNRITVDFEGDEPTTKVLDATGKVTALTVADLEKEILGNKDFSAIIVASRASGGASPNGNKPGGGAPATIFQPNQQSADLSKLTPQQMVAHIQATKAAEQGN